MLDARLRRQGASPSRGGPAPSRGDGRPTADHHDVRIVVRMSTFTDQLRARTDDELVTLLRLRPDLGSPSPATLASLAVRATSRMSLERALAAVDAAVLQALEAVVALAAEDPPTRDGVLTAVAGPAVAAASVAGPAPAGSTVTDGTDDDDPPDPTASAAADRALVGRALDDAVARALVWADDSGRLHPSPGLAEVLGPYPAGLAAPAATPTRPGVPPPPADVHALLAEAPAGARAVLEALTWGPPVGIAPEPSTAAGRTVAWLVRRGALRATDARHVVLPRTVALALRGGRTHPEVAREPMPSVGRRWPASLVGAESAAAAERAVRLVGALVDAWGRTPPAVLRAGGLGVRDLRRLAQRLEVDEDEAAFVAELAAAAGLVVDDGGDPPAFVPTDLVDGWAARSLPERWAALATAWRDTMRTPWLVGTRDDRGGVRSALDPELHRRWAPRVRRTVLEVLASAPEGLGPGAGGVLDVLRWRAPRSVPPEAVVRGLLTEAARLGVTGAGALSPAGRALLTDDPAAPAAALTADLPETVDELVLQADLTGIVPGRPSPRLEALLARTATVESRGGALTVRFTPESLRVGLDAGVTADDLLGELATVSRGHVPQPLEYLVRDAARRHGRLRAGAALAYLRADDPALLAGLPDDPRFASLGLVLLAPTVLAASVPPAELVEALRERGLAPVLEGPDGSVVHAQAAPLRVRVRPSRAQVQPASDDEHSALARATALVPRLRRAEEAVPQLAGDLPPLEPASPEAGPPTAPAAGAPRPDDPEARTAAPVHVRAVAPVPDRADVPDGTADPALALLLLREAADERTPVWVELVGARGELDRRLLVPVRVDGGRLRAVDPAREAELTVAVHRIASVHRARPAAQHAPDPAPEAAPEGAQ